MITSSRAPQPPRTRAPQVLPAVCLSCGAVRTGSYCVDCGQREVRGRHTLRSLLAGALSRILTVDSGLLHTAHQLTVSPGQVIRDYLAGRTQPYTHPAMYLLISF